MSRRVVPRSSSEEGEVLRREVELDRGGRSRSPEAEIVLIVLVGIGFHDDKNKNKRKGN
jgi:hypothetical protein